MYIAGSHNVLFFHLPRKLLSFSDSPINIQHLSLDDLIPSDTWLTTVLFDPPDSTARAVNVCMDLLKSLSTYPNRVRKPSKVSGGPPTTVLSHRIRNQSVFSLYQKRRRLILCYLTQTCLLRLDELAPARGSVVWPDSYDTDLPQSSSAHLMNAGDAFVYKFRQLVGSPESPTSARRSSFESSESVHPPLVPYLLIKVNFLSKHLYQSSITYLHLTNSITIIILIGSLLNVQKFHCDFLHFIQSTQFVSLYCDVLEA